MLALKAGANENLLPKGEGQIDPDLEQGAE